MGFKIFHPYCLTFKSNMAYLLLVYEEGRYLQTKELKDFLVYDVTCL